MGHLKLGFYFSLPYSPLERQNESIQGLKEQVIIVLGQTHSFLCSPDPNFTAGRGRHTIPRPSEDLQMLAPPGREAQAE